MKQQVITTNFTAGEFTPRLRGRVDLEKFNASAEALENCVVLRHGGITIRPSRDWCGEVKTSTQQTRLIPFVFSRADAYVLELGNQYMRVWKNGVRLGAPYELATPWTTAQLAALDFAQAGDTLVVVHPDVAPQRIQRFADTNWRCEAVPFDPAPQIEAGEIITVGVTLSLATVGTGRTATAAATFWTNADVGRRFRVGVGRALITGFTSGTAVTVTIEAAFDSTSIAANTGVLEGSPQTTCTPSAAGAVGTSTNLTAAVAAWRSSIVGRWIQINGGFVVVTTFTSATQVSGIIRRLLSAGTTAAPANSWALLGPAWDAVAGWPVSCAFFQQRLFFAGSARWPQTVWGSRTALPFDFSPGTDDDSAVSKTIDSDEQNIVQYLVAAEALVVLTYGGEFDITGGIEKPITQLNAQIRQRSRWGAELVRPEFAGKDFLYVQRGGKAVRAWQRDELDAVRTRDVSVYSEHLLRAGAKSMAWEQSPEQVVWIATAAGALLALTYNDEQNLAAFCGGNAEGAVEWVVTVPEGGIDRTYCITRYTVAGNTKRYIERINWSAPPGQDARLEQTGAPSDTWAGLAHLEGKTVAVVGDDVYMGTAVVTSGAITLPRQASKVSVGLPYSARARLQAPEIGTGSGTAQGQRQMTHRVWVRLLETIGCKVNGQEIAFRQLDQQILDEPVPPWTGLKEITEYGWESGDSPLEIVQDQPYPWTVLAVIRNMTANGG